MTPIIKIIKLIDTRIDDQLTFYAYLVSCPMWPFKKPLERLTWTSLGS